MLNFIMAYATKSKSDLSFSEAIRQEPDRFVDYAFAINSRIKDFSEFDDAFRQAFDTPNGKNAKIDSEDMIFLFESSYCKSKIRENVSEKQYDDIYGDGKRVTYEAVSNKKVVKISAPKTTAKGYKTRQGKMIKPYSRNAPKKFSGAEITFIKIRKRKGMKTSDIIKQYQQHFKSNERSGSSIRSKSYRL